MKRTVYFIIPWLLLVLILGSAVACIGGGAAATATPVAATAVSVSTSTPRPTPTPDCRDAFEKPDDNTTGRAMLLELDTVQRRTFHDSGDVDWIQAVLEGGYRYKVATQNLGSLVSTMLELYDEGGKRLAWNKCDLTDLSKGQASGIWLDVEKNAAVYVKVTNTRSQGGCGDEYGYEVTITRQPIPTPPVTVTPTKAAAPKESPPAPAALAAKWIDASQQTQIVDSAGKVVETWDVSTLLVKCRAGGLLASDESINPVSFASGYVGLEIMKAGQRIGWLRVGSIPSEPGKICRSSVEDPETATKCWTVSN